jgi:hypothetical protein
VSTYVIFDDVIVSVRALGRYNSDIIINERFRIVRNSDEKSKSGISIFH